MPLKGSQFNCKRARTKNRRDALAESDSDRSEKQGICAPSRRRRVPASSPGLRLASAASPFSPPLAIALWIQAMRKTARSVPNAGMTRIRFKGFFSVPFALAPWRALLLLASPFPERRRRVARRTSRRIITTGGTPLGTPLMLLQKREKDKKNRRRAAPAVSQLTGRRALSPPLPINAAHESIAHLFGKICA